MPDDEDSTDDQYDESYESVDEWASFDLSSDNEDDHDDDDDGDTADDDTNNNNNNNNNDDDDEEVVGAPQARAVPARVVTPMSISRGRSRSRSQVSRHNSRSRSRSRSVSPSRSRSRSRSYSQSRYYSQSDERSSRSPSRSRSASPERLHRSVSITPTTAYPSVLFYSATSASNNNDKVDVDLDLDARHKADHHGGTYVVEDFFDDLYHVENDSRQLSLMAQRDHEAAAPVAVASLHNDADDNSDNDGNDVACVDARRKPRYTANLSFDASKPAHSLAQLTETIDHGIAAYFRSYTLQAHRCSSHFHLRDTYLRCGSARDLESSLGPSSSAAGAAGDGDSFTPPLQRSKHSSLSLQSASMCAYSSSTSSSSSSTSYSSSSSSSSSGQRQQSGSFLPPDVRARLQHLDELRSMVSSLIESHIDNPELGPELLVLFDRLSSTLDVYDHVDSTDERVSSALELDADSFDEIHFTKPSVAVPAVAVLPTSASTSFEPLVPLPPSPPSSSSFSLSALDLATTTASSRAPTLANMMSLPPLLPTPAHINGYYTLADFLSQPPEGDGMSMGFRSFTNMDDLVDIGSNHRSLDLDHDHDHDHDHDEAVHDDAAFLFADSDASDDNDPMPDEIECPICIEIVESTNDICRLSPCRHSYCNTVRIADALSLVLDSAPLTLIVCRCSASSHTYKRESTQATCSASLARLSVAVRLANAP